MDGLIRVGDRKKPWIERYRAAVTYEPTAQELELFKTLMGKRIIMDGLFCTLDQWRAYSGEWVFVGRHSAWITVKEAQKDIEQYEAWCRKKKVEPDHLPVDLLGQILVLPNDPQYRYPGQECRISWVFEDTPFYSSGSLVGDQRFKTRYDSAVKVVPTRPGNFVGEKLPTSIARQLVLERSQHGQASVR